MKISGGILVVLKRRRVVAADCDSQRILSTISYAVYLYALQGRDEQSGVKRE